jgi:hypothetical protein
VAKDRKVEEKVAVASDKIRQLEDNLAFKHMTTAAADKTAVNFLSKPDRITSKDVHNMLMTAGFTPGLGNIADAADALLYAVEGEFGSAALSAAAMIPFVGQAVSTKKALKVAKESGEEMVTMWRGVEKWHQGTMVKKGKFIGGGDYVDPKYKKGLWISERKDVGANIASVEGGVLLEFEIPKSYVDKHFTALTRITKKQTGIFHEGLPKTFLKKVHKAETPRREGGY